MTGVQDHETLSIYPFDQQQIDKLLSHAGECTLNWTTKDGWPVGLRHSFVWHQGRVWTNAGSRPHRISVLRCDPRCSVVVSAGAASHSGIAGAITIKGRAIEQDDQKGPPLSSDAEPLPRELKKHGLT